jgi:uncharacterized membrane protein
MALVHFVIYGLLGFCAEVVFTAVHDAVVGTRQGDGENFHKRRPLSTGDRIALVGRTYLWVFPIYGGAALGFEHLHDAVGGAPWALRGLLYAAAILAFEAAAGLALRKLIGRCPWDYSHARTNVAGVVRLDYAPIWFVAGLGLERVHHFLRLLDGPIKSALLGS